MLRALRLDDLLALLFLGGLAALATVTAIPIPAALKYFSGLLAYYALSFLAVRRLTRSSSLSPAWKRGVLAGVLALIILLTLVAPGEVSLETLKNLVALSVPVLVAWTFPAGGEGARESSSGSEVRPDGLDAGPHGEPRGVPDGQPRGGWGVLRDITPFLISDAAYLMLHDIVHQVSPKDRDDWLIAADRAIFGGAVTQWLEPYVHPWWTEWFSATYSLFVFFPLTLALWFIARGERTALRHLLLSVILCNYLGYLGYLAVPAIGPMYTLSYEVPLSGGWFYQIKESLDQLARVPRDCFPSLHTANTFVVLLIVWRYARSLAWIYAPLCVSCIGATLYLRYHYTVDVLAGFLLGGGVVWAAPRLERAWISAITRWTRASEGGQSASEGV